MIARLMRLPHASQASAALAAETGGVAGLETVGAVKGARVLQTGVTITVENAATGAANVAMASHASQWSRQASGYLRWRNEAGEYLDIDGNVVDRSEALFNERTRIMHEDP